VSRQERFSFPGLSKGGWDSKVDIIFIFNKMLGLIQFKVEISDFLINQIKSYSWINDENAPDGTQILKILRYMCRLFSKQPKTIFVLRKSKLCHKGNRMKIADFYVARKWF
jgi:hypothetical protein